MSRTVAIFASGVGSAGAVSGRVGALATGLRDRGWTVDVLDLSPPKPSRPRELLDRLPPRISHLVEAAGFDGDVMPSIGSLAKKIAGRVDTAVAVVSVPPFSLLPAVARGLPARVPLVVDYRDPWSGRLRPSPVARSTRPIERRHLRTAAAVTYAGGPEMGKLLNRKLGVRAASHSRRSQRIRPR